MAPVMRAAPVIPIPADGPDYFMIPPMPAPNDFYEFPAYSIGSVLMPVTISIIPLPVPLIIADGKSRHAIVDLSDIKSINGVISGIGMSSKNSHERKSNKSHFQ